MWPSEVVQKWKMRRSLASIGSNVGPRRKGPALGHTHFFIPSLNLQHKVHAIAGVD